MFWGYTVNQRHINVIITFKGAREVRCQDKARALAMKILDLKMISGGKASILLAIRLVGNDQHFAQKNN